MGKIEGIFLNLQCDCHRVASMFFKTYQSLYQFQHFAAKCDSAMDKWCLPQKLGAYFFLAYAAA